MRGGVQYSTRHFKEYVKRCVEIPNSTNCHASFFSIYLINWVTYDSPDFKSNLFVSKQLYNIKYLSVWTEIYIGNIIYSTLFKDRCLNNLMKIHMLITQFLCYNFVYNKEDGSSLLVRYFEGTRHF